MANEIKYQINGQLADNTVTAGQQGGHDPRTRVHRKRR